MLYNDFDINLTHLSSLFFFLFFFVSTNAF